MTKIKQAIDVFLNKIVSRKLMVFLVATGLILASSLDSADWTFIAIAYIFAQGMIDIKELMNKK